VVLKKLSTNENTYQDVLHVQSVAGVGRSLGFHVHHNDRANQATRGDVLHSGSVLVEVRRRVDMRAKMFRLAEIIYFVPVDVTPFALSKPVLSVVVGKVITV
jgi:hypothetical protein